MYHLIQNLFTNTVRGTGILPVAHIGFADVLHSAAPIPIPVDGNERRPAIPTGQKPCIPMAGRIAFYPFADLFLEQRLCLLPIFSGNDGRVYILVTEPLFFGHLPNPFPIPNFVLMVIENTNITFVLKDVLDAGVRPEELTDIRFLLAVEFHLELRRCFVRLLIQNSGDGHKHIKDVDMLWDAKESQAKTLENINKKIDAINEMIESQSNAISEVTEFAEKVNQKYQTFVDVTNKTLDERQVAIGRRFDSREKAMQADFSDLRDSVIKVQEAQNKRIDNLSKSQTEKLFSIENAQAEKLGQIAENQSSALDAMKKAQDDQFAQMSREQVEWLESTNKSLEEEKVTLKENITALTQKVKTAYIVAGGAAAVTVVHILLSILGVL